MKRQATDWKRKFADYLSDIGFRTYEELSKLNSKKKESNKKFRKWVKDINSHLAEENIHVVLTVSALGVGGQSSSHA